MYITVLLGYRGFLILGDIYIPYNIDILITTSLFMVKFYMLAGIFWNKFSKSLILWVSPYILIFAISSFYFNISILTVIVLPVLYWVVITIYLGSWKGRIKRILSAVVIYCGFTIAINWIKTNIFFAGLNDQITLYQMLVLSINSIVILIILYGKEWIINERGNTSKNAMETAFSDLGTVESCSYVDSKSFQEIQNLVGWERAIAAIVWISLQMLSWIVILVVIKIISNVFWEALIISIAYAAYGYTVRYRMHFKWCTLASGVIFFVAARLVPSIHYTPFIPVLLALFLVYGSFRIALHFNNYNELEARLAIVNETIAKWHTFTLQKHCDYAQMKKVAESKGMTSKQIRILKLYYCDAANWAQINIAMAPWSESTTRKFLKQAKTDFEAHP